MKIKFFGGAQEVGRSAIMISDKTNIMLDYGTMLGDKLHYPISIPRIDGVVLSHAHIDHSGSVPALFNEMNIPILGTRPTHELSMLLLEDTLKIARNNRTHANFYRRELNKFDRSFIDLDYGATKHIGNMEITLYDAGHVCGSAITKINRLNANSDKRIVYTGDFKLSPQVLHEGSDVIESDVLIIESTYALRDHPQRDELIVDFINNIKTVLDNGGTALVPSFAVGRSQELLAILQKYGLSDITYLDGMARKATEIVLRNKKFVHNQNMLAEAAKRAIWVDDQSVRDEALTEPAIILTTAGMLNGGPVLNYIRRLNKKSHIFLTGYQVEGTNGRSLIEKGTVEIDNRSVKIETPMTHYDFSAHAGMEDLHEYVKKSKANTVICVHGDKESTLSFAGYLNDKGFKAYAPAVGETIEI